MVTDESETSTVMMNVGKRSLAPCGWLPRSAPATSSLPHSTSCIASSSIRRLHLPCVPTNLQPELGGTNCIAHVVPISTGNISVLHEKFPSKCLKQGRCSAFINGASHSCGAVVARRSYKIRQTLMTHLGYADAVGSNPTRYVLLKRRCFLLPVLTWYRNT